MGEIRDCKEGFGRSTPEGSDILLDDLQRRRVILGKEDWRTEAYPISHYLDEEDTALWPATSRMNFGV